MTAPADYPTGTTLSVDPDTRLLANGLLVGGSPARVLAVPLGSTEQHGPHLPLSTDTDVARALCDRLAEARVDVRSSSSCSQRSNSRNSATAPGGRS